MFYLNNIGNPLFLYKPIIFTTANNVNVLVFQLSVKK